MAFLSDKAASRSFALAPVGARKRTPDASAGPHLFELPTIGPVIAAAVGFARTTKTRFHTAREPSAGKGAERGTDPDQKQRAGARRRYGCGQLAVERRVAECAELQWRSVDDGLRLIGVGTAGIAHERAGHLIDRSRGARGIAADQ